MRQPLGVLIFLLAALATGCDLVGVRGSGDVLTESREVSGFNEIMFKGSGRATIEVTGEESLTIEAEDNLLPLLTSEVEDGVLELSAAEAISPTRDIVYTITVSSLEAITVQGSGTVTAPDIEAETFELVVSGSGEISLHGLTSDQLWVRITGSGDGEVSGSTNHLMLDVRGSGDYLGEEMIATTADVDVSGSGNATLNVTDHLEAVVSGSGSIIYHGEPASVDSSISGSGEVEEG